MLSLRWGGGCLSEYRPFYKYQRLKGFLGRRGGQRPLTYVWSLPAPSRPKQVQGELPPLATHHPPLAPTFCLLGPILANQPLLPTPFTRPCVGSSHTAIPTSPQALVLSPSVSNPPSHIHLICHERAEALESAQPWCELQERKLQAVNASARGFLISAMKTGPPEKASSTCSALLPWPRPKASASFLFWATPIESLFLYMIPAKSKCLNPRVTQTTSALVTNNISWQAYGTLAAFKLQKERTGFFYRISQITNLVRSNRGDGKIQG